MAIIARDSGGGDFEPAPEGLHAAICVDVVDLGDVESQWGKAHMIRISWQLDGHGDAGLRNDGKQWLVSRRFRLSLHEKSALRPFLESWRGKKFTSDELAGFDVENVINAACMIQVFHNNKPDGKVFANVQNVMPLPKAMPKPVASEYVRVVQRSAATEAGYPPEYADDEEPF